MIKELNWHENNYLSDENMDYGQGGIEQQIEAIVAKLNETIEVVNKLAPTPTKDDK